MTQNRKEAFAEAQDREVYENALDRMYDVRWQGGWVKPMIDTQNSYQTISGLLEVAVSRKRYLEVSSDVPYKNNLAIVTCERAIEYLAGDRTRKDSLVQLVDETVNEAHERIDKKYRNWAGFRIGDDYDQYNHAIKHIVKVKQFVRDLEQISR